jgi:DUF917 family protein
VGTAIARRVLGPTLERVRAAELPPDALVIHAGIVGAPDIVSERLPAGDEWEAAVRALEHHLRRTAAAVGVIEIGGLNAVIPFIPAVALGLPVVDGDLMGRAFPRLDQMVLSASGPVALVGSRGERVVLECPTMPDVERVVRTVIPSLGGAAAFAGYAVDAGTLARDGIAGSVSRAVGLGHALLADALEAEELFAGRVAAIEREGALHLRSIVLEDPADPSRVARVDMGDEYLALAVDGETVAVVPDIICLLDREERRPVAAGRLRVGRHVLALRLEPPPETRALGALVGPGAFGL